jgi:pSer/pThr/pTyr-binding forkhead associated (FHA) protein/V8-like Glu-specific endopeptidase
MRCEFRILSGGRAGHREVFDKPYIGLGRHLQSDFRFDADKDLDASTRHAAVLKSGDHYVLRDLGSRNGTFVNGHRITADHILTPGDHMRFGPNGPEVEFHIVADGAEQVVAAVHAPASSVPPRETKDAASHRPLPPTLSSGPSRTSVLRAQVSQQSTRYRVSLVVLGLVVVAAVVVVLLQGRFAKEQVATIGSQVDSLNKELHALRIAQSKADSEASALRTQLQGEHDPTRLAALQQRYAVVQQQRHGISEAQGVDWSAINHANARATAMIYVQFIDDSVFTGTGFGVTAAGLLLTNKHVVLDHSGHAPARIGVQFAGTTDVLHAVLDRVSVDADIATVRITDPGTYPVVQGLRSDGGSVGDPIALLGFPGGLDAPMGGTSEHPVVVPTLAPGTIGKILPDSLLQLDAYSTTGASGSPILDRQGHVIGIEFGGLRESAGRIVLGLPIKRAAPLLSSSSKE